MSAGGGIGRDVRIVEVGPRDGLQNERSFVPTPVKVELARRLAAAGVPELELTSLVSPRAVPQLADAEEVLAAARDLEGPTLSALVPNERGLERLTAHPHVETVAVFTAASEEFNRRNINASIEESLERIAPVIRRSLESGRQVRAYVSMAFGCPWEGPVDPGRVGELAGRLVELGAGEVALGDTIGVAVPAEVGPMVRRVCEHLDVGDVALHLHDTRGTGIACAIAGLDAGVTTFDTAVAGLGGCPFADGATGNLATEDLAWVLERSGCFTGIDLDALLDASRWISGQVGLEDPRSHLARAPAWPPNA